MNARDREDLLRRMKESGGGPVALQMEVYDLWLRLEVVFERIAAALERPHTDVEALRRERDDARRDLFALREQIAREPC